MSGVLTSVYLFLKAFFLVLCTEKGLFKTMKRNKEKKSFVCKSLKVHCYFF